MMKYLFLFLIPLLFIPLAFGQMDPPAAPSIDSLLSNVQTGGMLVYDGINWVTSIFKLNSVTITCSGTDKLNTLTVNNQTGIISGNCTTDQTGSGGGATTLSGNVTAPTRGVHTQVFSIPLTANSGNAIHTQLVVSSSLSDGAVIAAANLTNNQAHGTCLFGTPTGATTNTLDLLTLNSTGNAPTTLETKWLPVINDPVMLFIDCAVTTGATPGNLRIFITPETTTMIATAKAGSYLKTP